MPGALSLCPDYQRGQIALRYEEMIRERMQLRMSEGGKTGMKSRYKGGSNEQPLEKTSTREELAKIANVSPATMERRRRSLFLFCWILSATTATRQQGRTGAV